MKRALLLLLVTGCPSDPQTNPAVLWLSPDQNETHVKLIDHEPPPF